NCDHFRSAHPYDLSLPPFRAFTSLHNLAFESFSLNMATLSSKKRLRTSSFGCIAAPEAGLPISGPSPVSAPNSSTAVSNSEWPASDEAIRAARSFLKECATARLPTLLLPDKDADGLCGGLIIYRTLISLGLPAALLSVHFVAKGSNVHAPEEREKIAEYGAKYVVVVDQGSRGGPAIADGNHVKSLLVDHHWSEEFPDDILVLSAAHHPPIATSSTLAYVLCLPLVMACSRSSPPTSSDGAAAMIVVFDIKAQLDYLCAIGTMGDLGAAFRWEAPFPDMKACFKRWTKKVLSEAVSLLNAPRRTAKYDVASAWNALLGTASPRALTNPSPASTGVQEAVVRHIKRLHQARAEVKAEVERCTHTAPTFSGDGRVALIRISSGAQVHPLIATRWAATLRSVHLEMVMCANDGYLAGRGLTNFACRVARCATSRTGDTPESGAAAAEEGAVDVIAMLEGYASQVPGLREAMGDNLHGDTNRRAVGLYAQMTSNGCGVSC
ncbi:hypothetical protein B0H21DRAFT_852204, partial [Amylocystis lapponica]